MYRWALRRTSLFWGFSIAFRWFERKLDKNRARLRISSWSASDELVYAAAMSKEKRHISHIKAGLITYDIPVDGGIILLTEVMTMVKRMTNLGSYSEPTTNPAISDRHFKVTFLNSGTSKNYDLWWLDGAQGGERAITN